MNKIPAVIFLAALALASPLVAQDNPIDLFKQIDSMDAPKATPTPSPAPGVTPSSSKAFDPSQGPTIITAKDHSTFDGPSKVATLYGDVHVMNPQFNMRADKLTVIFHKDVDPKETPGATKTPDPTKSPAKDPAKSPTPKKSASPSSSPKPSAPPGDIAEQAGGIEKVIAEGNVEMNSERPDPNGGPTAHYAGKAAKVIYIPATGEMQMYGNPELQKDKDTLVATDDSTTITLNRSGTMEAHGPHKFQIQDEGPDKKTPVPQKTPEMHLPETR